MSTQHDKRYDDYANRIRWEDEQRRKKAAQLSQHKEVVQKVQEEIEAEEAEQVHEVKEQIHKRRRRDALVLSISLSLAVAAGWWLWPKVPPVEEDPTQSAYAARSGLPIQYTNSVGMVFRLIPPGAFLMGSAAEEYGRKDDEWQHRVVVTSPFYMAVTETTQSDYLEVMGNNPSFFKNRKGELPVDSVSWLVAAEFCNELSRREGLPEVYEPSRDGFICHWTRGGYRMPYETEWEYAARAGTSTAFYSGPIEPLLVGRASLSRIAWYGENAKGAPHPVGSGMANPWGLYDMLGNLLEWCNDWHEPYPRLGRRSFTGPDSGTIKVLRGGGWYSDLEQCRAAARRPLWPTGVWNSAGFRCVRTATP